MQTLRLLYPRDLTKGLISLLQHRKIPVSSKQAAYPAALFSPLFDQSTIEIIEHARELEVKDTIPAEVITPVHLKICVDAERI